MQPTQLLLNTLKTRKILNSPSKETAHLNTEEQVEIPLQAVQCSKNSHCPVIADQYLITEFTPGD